MIILTTEMNWPESFATVASIAAIVAMVWLATRD
jgi:hypothetical protein